MCPIEANDERQHQHIHRICRLVVKPAGDGVVGVCFLKLTFFFKPILQK